MGYSLSTKSGVSALPSTVVFLTLVSSPILALVWALFYIVDWVLMALTPLSYSCQVQELLIAASCP
jgi:hypothetical protein